MKKLVTMAIISGTLFGAAPAMAAMTDSLIEGAKLCTKHLPRYEREYAIPTHLLSAIASTESGRYHQGLKIAIPWPWTINAEGKGYYYDSKAEAIAAARKFRMQGVKSMDVGCMQVNLLHHPQAFSSLEQAFEPQNNIAYAASFLRSLYESDKSWKSAAAAYHSRTPSRGKQYVGNVYDSWYNIVSKLREAKLQAPGVTTFAQSNEQPQQPVSSSVKRFDAASQQLKDVPETKPVQVAALPEQRGTQQPAFKSPRMNSITVTRQEDKRENGIIVVRPEIKVVDDNSVKVAKAPETPDIITTAQAAKTQAAPEAKIVRLDNAVARAVVNAPATTASGPRFIFDN